VQTSVRLAIDDEQNACYHGTDPGDGIHDSSADAHAQQYKPSEDQVDTQQDPFQTVHFKPPLDEWVQDVA
jgi:hypothetical protein